jgi:butyryl-CoA dehydrogenase
MNYLLTNEQREIQKLARDFFRKELAPVVAEYDRKGEFPIEVYKKASEAGIHCIELPAALGGAGMDQVSCAVVNEEITKVDAGFGCALGANSLGVKPILMAGTDEQKKVCG